MASLFKKQSDKEKKEKPGQPSQPEGSHAAPPPSPPPPRKAGLFGKKGPRKPKMKEKPVMPPPSGKRAKGPREKKPKPPKGRKKPLFSSGRKKAKPLPPPVMGPPAPRPPAGAPPVAEKPPVSGPATPGAPPAAARPEKKGLFGKKAKPAGAEKRKKPKKEKPVRGKKVRQPREKKVKAPREKKVRAPREKKPKGPKKPLFSFGKKKAMPPAPVVPPAAGEPVPEGAEEAVAGAPRGKRGPRKPRVKEPRAPRKKARAGGFGGAKTSPVGLDLGRSSISAARLRHQTGGSILLQAALDTLPDGLIQEGEVKDVEALAFAIREFWKAHKIKSKKVALGLGNQKVVVRTLQFPLLAEKELRSAIEFQAQDYIPIPVEEAVFDFHILGRVTDEEGIEKQKVLVVAAQKDMVMDFINAVKRARLSVAGVDLQAFALLRALAPTSFLEQGMADRATAVANISSDITNLVVDVGGEPQFTRIISFGGDDFTKAVQDLEGISFVEAEEVKARVGLAEPSAHAEEGSERKPPGGTAPPSGPEGPQGMPEQIPEGPTMKIPPGGMPPEPGAGPEEAPPAGTPPEGSPPSGPPEGVPPAGTPPEGPPPGETPPPGGPPSEIPPTGAPRMGFPEGFQPGEKPPAESGWGPATPGEPDGEVERTAELQRVLELTADTLADEIRRSLDYYMSQEQSVPIGSLIISGGGAMLRNLEAHLAQVFPFPVEMGNPLQRISQNKSDLTDEELQALAPRLTISIGLALEDEE